MSFDVTVNPPTVINVTIDDSTPIEVTIGPNSGISVVAVAKQGVQGPTGPQGTKGDKGDTGASGTGIPTGGTINQALLKNSSADGDAGWKTLTYTHTQNSPALTWNIVHNLNKFPSVEVVDSGGTVAYGTIVYIDSNNMTLTFSALFSGKAYLN